MADSLFIVSRDELGTYIYLTHALAWESADVVLDRRMGDRRRIHRQATPERRYGERRHRDISRELQASGLAQIRASEADQ